MYGNKSTRGPQQGANAGDHAPQSGVMRNYNSCLRPFHESEINLRVKLNVCLETNRQVTDTLTIPVQVITQLLHVHKTKTKTKICHLHVGIIRMIKQTCGI